MICENIALCCVKLICITDTVRSVSTNKIFSGQLCQVKMFPACFVSLKYVMLCYRIVLYCDFDIVTHSYLGTRYPQQICYQGHNGANIKYWSHTIDFIFQCRPISAAMSKNIQDAYRLQKQHSIFISNNIDTLFFNIDMFTG